ncbi:hypothetical protein GCM10022243_17260 [Saccharothrix violaceirubra]|uniref:Regulator of protease activity HflC (Stomatin/prohibitin superfamily) n=1 Tax=Saccharothrix violaceirubra TaxID=413306 RepID=A0A7W7T6S4_9PSEU|nr:SPFH domain-containing protein [Saccharothrix violaceirubra]MBB4967585.1 regulator of protease activity HflC (stomatin/prohibitin superfamily) [Saccharothrix violaceirubra]
MKHTFLPWERGVHFRRGVIVGELGPGEHRLRRDDVVKRVDVRAKNHVGAWQDIPTADGVLVRVTSVLKWMITDAVRYLSVSADPVQDLHLAAQLALRAAVLTRPHDRVEPERAAIGAEVLAALGDPVTGLGLVVEKVDVRDVIMPAELRKAALAEIVARAEGRAALERARGETAAVRSLLNAARLAEEHPALLQLRALQSAGTVVVDGTRR